ncbi:MAG: hypothetical protein AAFR64_09330 [Pseudomonadota bacterium]
MTCITARKFSLAAAAALALGSLGAPTPAEAQVRALLPTIDEMEPLEDLPIDGVWEIRELGKRIVINDGHGYAEDSWVHMMMFRIEPDQVVLKNIRELANGDYIAQDLPLLANVTFEWVGDETLRGQTDSLIPAIYHLDRLDDFGGGYGDDDFRRRPRPGDDIPLIDDPLSGDDDEDPIDPW